MLHVPDRPPFELVPALSETDPLSDVVLLCDHASNAVPAEIGSLGLPAEDMNRHIAFDVGARGVTLRMAETLGIGAILSTFSRLVIDPNRGEQDPTLVMKLYDGSIIEGNRHVGAVETEERLNLYHRPYHATIRTQIDAIEARGGHPVLVSIHSFTPQLRGRGKRPWHIGLLWDRDDRVMRPLMRRLVDEPGMVVGDNLPYSGQLAGDCMSMHGTGRGLPHVLVEIRNDLISDGEGEAFWATLLAARLRETIEELHLAGTHRRWI